MEPSRRSGSHNPSLEVSKALTPVPSSSSKFWMYERYVKSAKKKRNMSASSQRHPQPSYERAVKIGKEKKRLKEHVLVHHTGLDLTSF